jgi:hypothetical protein
MILFINCIYYYSKNNAHLFFIPEMRIYLFSIFVFFTSFSVSEMRKNKKYVY